MTRLKTGNIILDDVGMTAERVVGMQDSAGTMALLQDVQNNNADKPSMKFVSGSYVINSASATAKLVGSDATLLITTAAGSASPATNIQLAAADGSGYTFAIRQKTGGLELEARQNSGSVDLGISLPGVGIPCTIALTRYNGKVRGYLNGIPGNEVTQAATSVDTNLALIVASGDYTGHISKSIMFNYALSAEKIKYYSAGGKLLQEDIGGSMENRLSNGNFSSGGTNWLQDAGVTYGTSAIFTSVADNNGIYQGAGLALPIVSGKLYKITYTITVTSGAMRVGIDIGGTRVYGSTRTLSGTYTDVVTAAGSGSSTFVVVAVGTTSGTVDDISVVQLGALVAYEPESINNKTWPDSSGNLLHGTVTNAIPYNQNFRGAHIPISASDEVPAGCVGRPVKNVISRSAAVGFTSGSPTALCSVQNQGPGYYRLSGFIGFIGSGTITAVTALINKVADVTTDVDNGRVQWIGSQNLTNGDVVLVLPVCFYILVNDTDDFYLTFIGVFTGAVSVYGTLTCEKYA